MSTLTALARLQSCLVDPSRPGDAAAAQGLVNAVVDGLRALDGSSTDLAIDQELVNHISNVTDSHPDKLLLERLGQALGGRQRTLGRNAGLQAVEGALLRPSLEVDPTPALAPTNDPVAATSALPRAALATQLGLDAAYARVYDASGTERGLDDNHVTLLHGVLAPDVYGEVMRASGVTASHASLAGLQHQSLHGRPKARWTLAQAEAFAFRPSVSAASFQAARAGIVASSGGSAAAVLASSAASPPLPATPSAAPFFAALAQAGTAPPADEREARMLSKIDLLEAPGSFARIVQAVLRPALDFLASLAWPIGGVLHNPFVVDIASSWGRDLLKNYKKHIVCVMDLPTMQASIVAGKYASAGEKAGGSLELRLTRSAEAFLYDARLIARNARYFNCPPSFVDAVKARTQKKPREGDAEALDWFPSVQEVQEKFPGELHPVFVAGWDFFRAAESLRPTLAAAWLHAITCEKRAELARLKAQLAQAAGAASISSGGLS